MANLPFLFQCFTFPPAQHTVSFETKSPIIGKFAFDYKAKMAGNALTFSEEKIYDFEIKDNTGFL